MFEQMISEYWKTVVDTVLDGIMIVDKGGTIVSVNRAFERITGFPRSQVIGEPCTIIRCNTCRIAREKRGEHWCALFRTGKERMCRGVITRADGQHLDIIKNASLFYDGDGDVIGAVETLTDISELVKKENQIEEFKRRLHVKDGFMGIIGTSPLMKRVYDLISNAAQSDAPVIILGESGTGKELIAEAIHKAGPRKNGPFVKVNCAALNESLLESELFGHVKGAFTGAIQNRKGRFEAAQGGDIFLDEVGDLPLSTQVKLLRVLEEKVIERVGDNRPVRIDVRIISATNKNLKELVKKGEFRQDLYYRINVIPVYVPPLRERKEDIPLLAETFFRTIRLKYDKPIESISSSAMAALMNYPWPGNVRELKSALEYAFVTCDSARIEPSHLPPEVTASSCAFLPGGIEDAEIFDSDAVKKEKLIAALEEAGGNQSRAARILGVSRVTVWNWMKKYGIRPRWK